MEELRSCASQLMLHLKAGCTAPPPTPVRPGPPAAADPFSSLSAHHHLDQTDVETSWSSAPDSGPSFCKAADIIKDDDDDDGRAECNSLETMHRNSTPPSRVELDELALYLMQQSLRSTPTLLASPSSRKKQGMRPYSGNNTAISERAAGKSGGGGEETQRIVLMSGGGLSTFSYSMDGFCEKSKMSIRRACEEEGALYVLLTDIGEASVAEVENLCKQCPGMDRVGLISSGPLLPLSELMDQDSGTMSLEKAYGATTDANFREAMTMFGNLLVKISKEFLKILLKDICSETSTNLTGCSLKPLLYMYKNVDQEAHVARHDGDLLLSIISRGNANQQFNVNEESILIVLGSHIQAWSKGKFKAPSLFSVCNLVDGDICMQLDLVYYIKV